MFAGTLRNITAESLSLLHNLPKSQDEFQPGARSGRGGEAVIHKTATEKPALVVQFHPNSTFKRHHIL